MNFIPGKLYRPTVYSIPLWKYISGGHFVCEKWIVNRDILFCTGAIKVDAFKIVYYEFLYNNKLFYLRPPYTPTSIEML